MSADLEQHVFSAIQRKVAQISFDPDAEVFAVSRQQCAVQPIIALLVQRDQRGVTGSAPDIPASQSAGQIQLAQRAGPSLVTAIKMACQIIVDDCDVVDIDSQLSAYAPPTGLTGQGGKRQRFPQHARRIHDELTSIDAQPAARFVAIHIHSQTGKAGHFADLIYSKAVKISLEFVAIRFFRCASPLRIQIEHLAPGRIRIQTRVQSGVQRQKFSQAGKALQLQQVGAHFAVGRLFVASINGAEIKIGGLKFDPVLQAHRQTPGGNLEAARHILPCGATAQAQHQHFRHILGQLGRHVI